MLKQYYRQEFPRYFPDWVLATIASVVFYFILETATPRFREFRLDDQSISHSFSHDQMVTDNELYVLVVMIPLIIMILISRLMARGNGIQFIHVAQVTALGLVVNLAITGIITDFLKLWISRPRPDFLARCNAKASAPIDKYVGIEVCQLQNFMLLIDGMKSCPSGHSSLAFSGTVYFCLWLNGQFKLYKKSKSLILQLLSWSYILMAVFIAISRSSDYRHHYEDIIFGSLIGIVVSIIVYFKYFPGLNHETSHLPISEKPTQILP